MLSSKMIGLVPFNCDIHHLTALFLLHYMATTLWYLFWLANLILLGFESVVIVLVVSEAEARDISLT